MTDEEAQITDEQAKQLASQLYGLGPTPDDGQKGIHAFLTHIALGKETTRVGYLTEEELGMPKLPERTVKELALFCKNVANEKEIGEYFEAKAEILTATSLSKEGFLAKLAVITRRETSNILKVPKKNKGWFGKKKQSSEDF